MIKTLFIATLGMASGFVWSKATNQRALTPKLKIKQGIKFFLINPGYLEFTDDCIVGD